MYSGITKTQRITKLQKMQLTPTTISNYQTAETGMQDSYAQAMKNKLYLLDLYKKKVINTFNLIGYQIHFRFYMLNGYRISIPLLENPKIEITQTIVSS